MTLRFYTQSGVATTEFIGIYNKQLTMCWPMQTLVVAMALHPSMKRGLLHISEDKDKGEGEGGGKCRAFCVSDLLAMVESEARRLLGDDMAEKAVEVFKQQYCPNSDPFCEIKEDVLKHENYVTYWQTIKYAYEKYAPLADLALQLGMVNCNSAAMERKFSQVQLDQTGKRNRLNDSQALGMAVARVLRRQFGKLNVSLKPEDKERILQYGISRQEAVQMDNHDNPEDEHEAGQENQETDQNRHIDQLHVDGALESEQSHAERHSHTHDMNSSEDDVAENHVMEEESITWMNTFDSICDLKYHDLEHILDIVFN